MHWKWLRFFLSFFSWFTAPPPLPYPNNRLIHTSFILAILFPHSCLSFNSCLYSVGDNLTTKRVGVVGCGHRNTRGCVEGCRGPVAAQDCQDSYLFDQTGYIQLLDFFFPLSLLQLPSNREGLTSIYPFIREHSEGVAAGLAHTIVYKMYSPILLYIDNFTFFTISSSGRLRNKWLFLHNIK